jgi:hypothetical protein
VRARGERGETKDATDRDPSHQRDPHLRVDTKFLSYRVVFIKTDSLIRIPTKDRETDIKYTY